VQAAAWYVRFTDRIFGSVTGEAAPITAPAAAGAPVPIRPIQP